MMDREYYLMLAEQRPFQGKVARALACVADALNQTEKPYVSVSGGKDSTVVLHLVRSLMPDCRAIYHDDEFILPETQDYLKSISNLHVLHTEARHTEWFVTNAGQNDLAALDYDSCFLGLRAEENSYRRKHLLHYGLTHLLKNGKTNCSPIGWWSVDDVWAYIHSNHVPYNRAYDVMGGKEIPVKNQRIGPFANHRALQYGQANILKQCFPASYNKFAAKYPIIRTYA